MIIRTEPITIDICIYMYVCVCIITELATVTYKLVQKKSSPSLLALARHLKRALLYKGSGGAKRERAREREQYVLANVCR